jgi:hypothetical protein
MTIPHLKAITLIQEMGIAAAHKQVQGYIKMEQNSIENVPYMTTITNARFWIEVEANIIQEKEKLL